MATTMVPFTAATLPIQNNHHSQPIAVNPVTEVPNLAAKLQAKAAEIKAQPNKPKLELILDEEKDGGISFYCKKEDLLRAVGPSSTGGSEGVTLSVAGEFTFGFDGRTYSFKLAMRGGWATVKMIASDNAR